MFTEFLMLYSSIVIFKPLWIMFIFYFVWSKLCGMIFRYLAGILCFHLLFLWTYNQICPCCLWSVPGLGRFPCSSARLVLISLWAGPAPNRYPRVPACSILTCSISSSTALSSWRDSSSRLTWARYRSSLYSRTAIMPWLLIYQKQTSLDVCSQDRILIYFTSLVIHLKCIWGFGFCSFKMWNVIHVCGCVSWMDLCLFPAAHVEVQREASSPADPVRGHGLRGFISGRRPSGQGEGGVSERAGESRGATQPAARPPSQPG